jgi:hypothetical protein
MREKYPQFRMGEPNDVQEVVLCVIDVFEKSMGKEFIYKHFYGKTESTIDESVSVSDFSIKTLDPDDDLFVQTQHISSYERKDGSLIDTDLIHKIITMPTIFMISYNIYNDKKDVTLKEYIEFEDKTYKLYACALHNSNHYAALVKHKNEWYIKNDTQVIKIDEFHPTSSFYFAMYKS